MKLGFFAPALRMLPLQEIMKWAGKSGFHTVEFWPTEQEDKGVFVDSFLNIAKFDQGRAAQVREMAAEARLDLAAITFSANMLDPARSEKNFATMKRVIDAAQLLGIGVVGCWAGRDYALKVEENVKLFGQKFPELCKYAADRGVKLAMENCPLFWEREGLVGNIAYSPAIWEKLFNEVPAENLGLNFDPSHAYWMQIDSYRAIKEFGKKIFWFHAKDCEVDEDRLAREGNIPYWTMNWRYRIPGAGRFDWARMLSALYEHGYRGYLSIEYEDGVYGHKQKGADPDEVKRGLMLGKGCLERHMM